MIDEVDFYLVDLKSKFDKIKPNTYYLSYSGGKDTYVEKTMMYRDLIQLLKEYDFSEIN